MEILNTLIHATSWALIVSLISIGLSIVFYIMDLFNLSHTSAYMIAVVLTYSIMQATNSYLFAIILAPLIVAIAAGFLERFVLRHVEGDLSAGVICTIGLMLFWQQVVLGVFGGKYFYIKEPIDTTLEFGLLRISLYEVFCIITCLALLWLLHLFLRKTRYGMSIRAISDDRETAAAVGINVNRILILIFALSAFLAAVGGILAAPVVGGFYMMDVNMLILACIVVVVGGIGSIYGTIIAAFVVVFTEYIGIAFLDPTQARVLSFILLVIVLLFQPTGIAGFFKKESL